MNFNKEQALAIETIDKNLGLIAGAGTGKTAVISERFINIVKNKDKDLVDALPEILCITFTEKAADEMKGRISSRLEKLLEENETSNLDAVIANLNISTIHSFCNEIIKANTYKLGLAKDYEIIEGNKADQLLLDTINNSIEDKMKDKDFKDFLIEEEYMNISSLANSLARIYRTIQSKAYDIEDLEPDFSDLDLQVDYMASIMSYYELIGRLLEDKVINGRLGLVKKYRAGRFDDLFADEYSSNEDKISDLNELKTDFLRAKNIKNREKIADSIDQIILSINAKYLYKYDFIHDLLKDIDKNFKEVKLSASLMEYDDLLTYSNMLLDDKSVLDPIKGKFSHIMIDEFQDTNSVQRDIFYKICSDERLLDRNNFFIVGDPKQSIYGFRGSDLRVFYETIEDIKESGGLLINLKYNYRSSKKLLHFYNQVFSNLMEDKYQGLDQDPAIHKSFERLKKEERSQIRIIGYEDTSESDAIARKIVELKDEFSYSDIAILYRSSKNLSELEESLDNYNIPYVNPKSKDFYRKREIKDLLLFLKFLNIPQDCHSLYGLLRSDFFLIEDYKIDEIYKDPNLTLYDNLLAYKGTDKKLIRAKEILKEALLKRDSLNIYENLRSFIDACSYIEFLAGTSSNMQSIENVNKFLNISLDYSLNENGFLNEFLAFIQSQALSDEAEASLEDSDSVNLLTIHSAKGLEFKVVFIFESDRSFYFNYSDKIKVHGSYGYGMNFKNTKNHFSKINDILRQEELEEYIRIFYVALTRAETSLYFLKDLGKKPGKESFLSFLSEIEGLDIDFEEDKARDCSKEYNIKEISSDQSQLVESKDYLDKARVISSISAYMTFKRCKREYYYDYILNLNKMDLDKDLDKEFEDEKIFFGISATDYGTLIHRLIEDYDGSDLDEYIKYKLDQKKLDKLAGLSKRIKRHLKNFTKQDLEGKSIFEQAFILDLDQGRIQGSIDQIIVDEDDYYIVDFKTNSKSSIADLVEYYRPQLLLYTMAGKKLFGKDAKGTYINFLDFDEFVQIKFKKHDLQKLEDDINKFLSFIGQHDNISLYNLNEPCNKNCKYKNICIG